MKIKFKEVKTAKQRDKEVLKLKLQRSQLITLYMGDRFNNDLLNMEAAILTEIERLNNLKF